MDAYQKRVKFSDVRVGQTFRLSAGVDLYIKVDSPFGNARKVVPGHTEHHTFTSDYQVYVIGGAQWDEALLRK